jgi:tRNA dimethylallyltransferase
MLIILGPTATGKTKLAVAVAEKINGAVISADSRQVFRGMTLGTGKDIEEYSLPSGKIIPYYLIDIRQAGEEYSAFDFVRDASQACKTIEQNRQYPIICGGTGFYLESFLSPKTMTEVPVNAAFRKSLETKSDEELIQELKKHKTLHNHTDTENRTRLIRALEIATFQDKLPSFKSYTPKNCKIFGVHCERKEIMQRITLRLEERLKKGMIDEVDQLLKTVSIDRLKRYGLEYRFIAEYLNHEISYDTMFERLNIAIRQFAKRQMTWFRRMERNGYTIHWLPFENGVERNSQIICEAIHRHTPTKK